MRTKRGAFTCGAVMVNVAVVLPAGTVTFCGVTTCPSMLPLSRTRAPPAGAGPVRVTVAVVVVSPRIALLARERDARLGAGAALPAGRRVSQLSGALYPSKAVPELKTTRVGTETAAVGMLKVAPLPPAVMLTLAGGVAREV